MTDTLIPSSEVQTLSPTRVAVRRLAYVPLVLSLTLSLPVTTAVVSLAAMGWLPAFHPSGGEAPVLALSILTPGICTRHAPDGYLAHFSAGPWRLRYPATSSRGCRTRHSARSLIVVASGRRQIFSIGKSVIAPLGQSGREIAQRMRLSE